MGHIDIVSSSCEKFICDFRVTLRGVVHSARICDFVYQRAVVLPPYIIFKFDYQLIDATRDPSVDLGKTIRRAGCGIL